MEVFEPYALSIAALAVFALMGLVLNPVSAARKAADGVASGALPEADYDNPTYRLSRAYMNAMELTGFFTAVTVAAMLAGASPFWVNLLASIFLVSRIVVAIVHIRGIGKANLGPRTVIFTVGWACCIFLAVLAIVAVL